MDGAGAGSGPDECLPIHSHGPPPAVLPRVEDFDPDSPGANPRRELTLLTSPEVAIRGTVTGLDGKPAKGVDLILMAVILWRPAGSVRRWFFLSAPRAVPSMNGMHHGVHWIRSRSL